MFALSRPTCGWSFLLSGTFTATAGCLASAGFLSRRPDSGHRGRVSPVAVGEADGVWVTLDDAGEAALESFEHAARAAPATPSAPTKKVRRSSDSFTGVLRSSGASERSSGRRPPATGGRAGHPATFLLCGMPGAGGAQLGEEPGCGVRGKGADDPTR